MTTKWLRRTRVLFALVFFLFTALIFLDFREVVGEKGVNDILFLQFVPSLLKFLTIFSISAGGFILIILLTVIFGRVYCSVICPLGILQDMISRAGKLFIKKKKRRYRYLRPRNILRYTLLAGTIITGSFFSIIILSLLDPYSLFGKLATGLFRPAGMWVNNILGSLLENMNIFFLYIRDLDTVHVSAVVLPVVILLVLVVMAGKYGRLYCNTICPVGTLLGLLSKYSFLKINFDQSACTRCGKCSFACKSGCISIREMSIDHSRCVACFDCLPVCNDHAIRYSIRHKEKKPVLPVKEAAGTDKGRKEFIVTLAVGLASLAGIRRLRAMPTGDDQPLNKKPTTVPVKKTSPVCPPGSLSIAHFTSLCTACQLCVSQCPSGVLQPSVFEYGITGYMQPHMDYGSDYCNFECIRCTEICPSGAILPVTPDHKKTLQMGKVNFIRDNCVVYTENTACGSCSEHCPTQAVKMVPYKGSLTIPEINNKICVGCGACEHACPVRPYKAIFVDGNPIHQIAEKPKEEKLETPDTRDDFPF